MCRLFFFLKFIGGFFLTVVLLKDLVDNCKRSNKGFRRKRSHSRKPTGFKNVYIVYCRDCRQGFYWAYIDKGVRFSSVDFFTLKSRVESMGLVWCEDNHYYSLRTAKLLGLPLYDLL